MPRKGTRSIIVDGVAYRWLPKSPWSCRQEGAVGLVVQLDRKPTSSTLELWWDDGMTLTPAKVAKVIRTALNKRWDPYVRMNLTLRRSRIVNIDGMAFKWSPTLSVSSSLLGLRAWTNQSELEVKFWRRPIELLTSRDAEVSIRIALSKGWDPSSPKPYRCVITRDDYVRDPVRRLTYDPVLMLP